jgi:NitT/TauT family transport system substrate-binding protein
MVLSRKVLGFAASCFLALGVSAGHAAEPKTVKVVLASYGLTFIPALIAHDQGFDREQGLDFAFTQAPGSIGVKAMLAGDVEFSLSAGASLSAIVAGAPLRVIGVHIPMSFYYLYAKKEYPKISDLAGKSLGIGAIGDSTDIAARKALAAGKVDASTVNFVSMGIENVPPSLIAGALDAGVVTPPRDIAVERTGKFVNLGFLGSYLPTPSSGFATTKKLIDTNPELVQRFTNAVMKGSDFLLKNKEGGVAAIMKYMKLSKEDAELAYQRYVPMFLKDGVVDLKTQQNTIDDQAKTIRTRRVPAPADVFDLSFVKKVPH